MITTLTAIIFTLFLLVGVPALSFSTARNEQVREMPRLALYLSAIFSQWLLAIVGLVVVFLIAPRVFASGFAATPLARAFAWSLGVSGAAVLVLAVVIGCERAGWLPREPELVYLLIPQTAREKFWAVLILAPTAAFCEEFLFRGFLLTQLHDWLHSLVWAWALSSVAFGLAHCYQGWSGMTRAALLGALLAFSVVRTGTLYPAMLAHWMIDTTALLWLGPWMLRANVPAGTAATE